MVAFYYRQRIEIKISSTFYSKDQQRTSDVLDSFRFHVTVIISNVALIIYVVAFLVFFDGFATYVNLARKSIISWLSNSHSFLIFWAFRDIAFHFNFIKETPFSFRIAVNWNYFRREIYRRFAHILASFTIRLPDYNKAVYLRV